MKGETSTALDALRSEAQAAYEEACSVGPTYPPPWYAHTNTSRDRDIWLAYVARLRCR